MGGGQDAGSLRHEMHAAEDDVIGIGASGGFTEEQEGVALGIGVLNHLFPLVVMAQDGDLAAQFLACFADSVVKFICCVVQVLRRNRLPPHIHGHLCSQGLGGGIVFGLAECRVLDLGNRHRGPAECYDYLLVASMGQ